MDIKQFVLWICGDADRAGKMMAPLLKKMWSKDIKSIMALFDSSEKVLELNKQIYDIFISWTIDKEIYDGAKVEELEKLVKTSDVDLPIADVAFDVSASTPSELWSEIIYKAADLKPIQDECPNLFVAIDICLLSGDESALLMDDVKPPLLSILLYDDLYDKFNGRVFLYSSLAAPEDAISNWVSSYKKFFADANKKDINIFNKFGEMMP